jgi:hypothetical protein
MQTQVLKKCSKVVGHAFMLIEKVSFQILASPTICAFFSLVCSSGGGEDPLELSLQTLHLIVANARKVCRRGNFTFNTTPLLRCSQPRIGIVEVASRCLEPLPIRAVCSTTRRRRTLWNCPCTGKRAQEMMQDRYVIIGVCAHHDPPKHAMPDLLCLWKVW